MWKRLVQAHYERLHFSQQMVMKQYQNRTHGHLLSIESDFNEHNSRWKWTARKRSVRCLYPPRDNTNGPEPPTVDGVGAAR